MAVSWLTSPSPEYHITDVDFSGLGARLFQTFLQGIRGGTGRTEEWLSAF